MSDEQPTPQEKTIDELKTEYETLVESDKKRIEALANQGIQLTGVGELWMHRLLETIAGEILGERKYIELQFEHRSKVAELIADVERQVREAQIRGTMPAAPSNGKLNIPGISQN